MKLALFSDCLPGWDSERVIAAAQELGLTDIEWAAGPGRAIGAPSAVQRVRAMCAEQGVRCIGLAVQDPGARVTDAQRAAAYVEQAVALGAGQVRFFAAPYDGGDLADLQRRHRDGLDALVQLAAPHGLQVLIETSPDTLACTPELALALVQHHPPAHAGVLYDPGNMVIEGHVSPELTIAILGEHLGHVHVKNVAWSRGQGRWRWRHAGLAAGILDWGAIVAALSAAGYAGRLSLDHVAGRPGVAAVRRETEYLRGSARL
jgi:sugar phosphate isomerase/epimerase